MNENNTDESADATERSLKARAYDGHAGGEHIADLYSWEAVAELKDAWWIRVEEVDDVR